MRKYHREETNVGRINLFLTKKVKSICYLGIIGVFVGNLIGTGLFSNLSIQRGSSSKENAFPVPITASSALFYNATWTCIGETVGSSPFSWNDAHAGFGQLKVVSDYIGHYRPLKLTDSSSSGDGRFYRNCSVSPSSGFIEYWLYNTDPICGYLAGRSNQTVAFSLHQSYGTWRANENDTGIHISSNTWIRIKISFTPSQVTFVVNGVQIAQKSWMNGLSTINNLLLSSGATVETGSSYYDALGLSWMGYQTGGNQYGTDLNSPLPPYFPNYFPPSYPIFLVIFLLAIGGIAIAGIVIYFIFRRADLQRNPMHTSRSSDDHELWIKSQREESFHREIQTTTEITRRYCPSCGSRFSQENVDRHLRGKSINCEKCGDVLLP